MLARSTQTIVKQVAQLKGMVDAFSQYARMPEMQLPAARSEHCWCARCCRCTKRNARAIVLELQEDLPPVHGDPARLRQVIHNLLQNAQQAVVESTAAANLRCVPSSRVRRCGSRCSTTAPASPPEMLARAFEPYVTTKAKGTGPGPGDREEDRRGTQRQHRARQRARAAAPR